MPEPAATRNLRKSANLTAKQMLAAVRKARKAFMVASEEALQKPSAWSDTGRAALNAEADAIFRERLTAALDRALASLASEAAEQGNAAAQWQAGEIVPRFSREYLAGYLSRVTPKNAPSLAAVYTASMAESAKASLRQTAVSVFTAAAATGLTTRERMRLFQSEWAARAKNDDPFRFADKAGRRWENARYVQMLARTTAQRVQTAAFCDAMLQGGFPLARISNDSGRPCHVCAEWQGRLIDLTPGHQLKGGTHTLAEARAAGVFHPNCTHRLEYVPLAEFPERLLPKVKGKLGQPGAFGDPRPSTHAGLPTKAKAKAHEKAVEKAAKERVGKDGMPADIAERIAPMLANLEGAGKRLGGSTGAWLVDVDGRKFVVKPGASEAHLMSEVAADSAYEAAGLRVPKHAIVSVEGGKRFKVAEFVEGEQLGAWWRKASTKERDAMSRKLADGLDVDAMLGNWDVIGMGADNVLVDKEGHPWRIDNGGALSYRAQGAKKAKKDWGEGWPDELFSMPGSPNNKAYVGETTPLRLVRQAAKRDWEAIIAKLPEADREPMRKRVAEMRQLAERAGDFARGGYTDGFTGRILKHSYNLSKEGFREEVPKTIKEGDYGFCRSKGATGGAAEKSYGELALAAAKTVGTHLKDGKYNQSTLNAFYAQEPALKAILKDDPKNAGAKHYLDVMAQIKHAAATNTALPMIDTSISVKEKKQKEATPKYLSLTDHIEQYMKAHKGNYRLSVRQWFMAQAKNSWNAEACNTKILELASRGENWTPPPPAKGVWYGDAEKDMWRKKNFDLIAGSYKKKPRNLEKDLENLAMYKAATQLLLENAAFEGNDREKREVILFRTEDKDLMVGKKKGERFTDACGPAESTSVFRTVVIKQETNRGTIVKVPYSRINGTYFLEGLAGDSNEPTFLGDGENEFNADLVGLERVYVGAVTHGRKVSEFYDFLK